MSTRPEDMGTTPDVTELLTNPPAPAIGGGAQPGSMFYGSTAEQYRAGRAAEPGGEAFSSDTQAAEEERTTEAKNRTSRNQQADALLRSMNLDPSSEAVQAYVQSFLIPLGASDTLEVVQSQLFTSQVPMFLSANPEAALTQPTYYDEALANYGFEQPYETSLELGVAQQRAQMTGSLPSGYETSDEGAIRFPNGTVVGPDGSVLYDPSQNAPGSPQWMRAAANWSQDEIDEWRQRLKSMGYLSKDSKGGFTLELQNALSNYWTSYYRNGGKPIASEQGADGGKPELPPPIDYSDFIAEAKNSMRSQLANALGVQPDEKLVNQFAQYVVRTAAQLQTQYRREDRQGTSSNLGYQYQQAQQEAIDAILTSPYARDQIENTRLRDALSNAASVTRSLIS